MNSEVNPLDSVWETYQTIKDCLKVTDRARRKGDLQLLQRTDFVILEEKQAVHRMQSCHETLEDFVILSLWAVFERYLVEYIQGKGNCLKGIEPTYLAEPLHEQFYSAVERWKFNDVLDLLAGTVDKGLLGSAKEVKRYRDYIAHRNPKKKPNKKTDPRMTYQFLSKIIQRLSDEEIANGT